MSDYVDQLVMAISSLGNIPHPCSSDVLKLQSNSPLHANVELMHPHVP